jgi:hypothetical protein
MPMNTRLRRTMLTAHIVFAVGWAGAVAAYLPLAAFSLLGTDERTVSAAFLAMEVVGWWVIVPLALAALGSGIVQALGTSWGLARHEWVLAKLALTLIAVTVLLVHMPEVSRMAAAGAAGTPPPPIGHGAPGIQLFAHAALGLGVLVAIVAISVFKPGGRTRFDW